MIGESLIEEAGIVARAQEILNGALGEPHVVSQVIDQLLPRIEKINQGSFKDSASVGEFYGFIARALTSKPYDLNPEDMVTIWSGVMKTFPGLHQRYALARAVIAAYVVRGAKRKRWAKVPEYFMETNELPIYVLSDTSDLNHVQRRLTEVSNSIEELNKTIGEKQITHEPAFLSKVVENFRTGLTPIQGKVQLALRNAPEL